MKFRRYKAQRQEKGGGVTEEERKSLKRRLTTQLDFGTVKFV